LSGLLLKPSTALLSCTREAAKSSTKNVLETRELLTASTPTTTEVHLESALATTSPHACERVGAAKEVPEHIERIAALEPVRGVTVALAAWSPRATLKARLSKHVIGLSLLRVGEHLIRVGYLSELAFCCFFVVRIPVRVPFPAQKTRTCAVMSLSVRGVSQGVHANNPKLSICAAQQARTGKRTVH
jgi:hypothetical protein